MVLQKSYENNLPATGINCIYEDKKGNLWVSLWERGLHKYDPETDSFISFPYIGSGNNPFSIFQDSKMNYWICTWGNGIYRFHPDRKAEEMYIQESPFNDDKEISTAAFYSIVEDNTHHYIWAMSFSGLYIFEYDEDQKLRRVPTPAKLQETNNIFNHMIKDRTGNLWIGTFNEGVINVIFDNPLIRNNSLSVIKEKTGLTPNIQTIYEDKEGDIWFHQNRFGAGIYFPPENKTLFHTDIPALHDIIGVSCITDFRSYPDEIWLGFIYQPFICRLHKKGKDIHLIEQIDLGKTVTNPGNPRIFFEDRKNNIWIVTTERLLLKPFYTDSILAIHDLPYKITGITEDIRGDIWLSSLNQGIFRITISPGSQPDHMLIHNYTPTNSALEGTKFEAICADSKGQVWIGTKEGNMLIYDIITDEFRNISHLFNFADERLLNIVTDRYGHIWISTAKRLIEFIPESSALYDYSEEDGIIINSFLKNSYWINTAGEILFGGNKGISIIKPAHKPIERKEEPTVFITDVKTDNISVFQKNGNNKFDPITHLVRFKPEDKNIEINFSTLNYTSPNKIVYAYKLEGVDQAWRYTDSGNPFAIYNKLTKGNYTFRVKATDKNRLWSNHITTLKIYKEPDFYETWWAYTLYVLLFILIFYTIFRFIYHKVELKNKLKIAQIEKEKSEELTQLKLRYFTNITHDILTPLTIISYLVDDAETTGSSFQQFGTIRSNLNRLKRLLQQILDFRKMESGNMQLTISQGDIVDFIRDICYNQFLPLLGVKEISFSFSAGQDSIPGYFDADKIDKVIFNLLSNAFKYTPPGGSVQVEVEKKNQNAVIIRVSDTGIGISPEEQQKIFTRFYSKTIGQSVETNGIGLSLVKELIELHHGTISVESTINKGSCFTVEIPVHQPDYIHEENLESPLSGIEEQERETELSSENTHILLVEDNKELLLLMKNSLSGRYHIFTSGNGKKALSIIKEQDIQIIVSDIMMPEMNGLELCKTVKENLETSHISVIILTAKNSMEDRINCYNAGADGYIAKPFNMKLLEARINNLVQKQKSKQKDFKSDVDLNLSTLEYQSIDEQFLTTAIEIIQNHIDKPDFDISILAQSLNVSKSSLYRKIKSMTGLSPLEFVRNIRLKQACRLLKDKSVSISEVAYASGFSDPKYFAQCFKTEFNLTPSEFQKQKSVSTYQ